MRSIPARSNGRVRVRGLVVEWAALHRDEMREAWNLAMQHAPLKPIPRLE